MSKEKLLYTPEDVAELLRVKTVTVHGWLRDGRLGGFRAGDKLWRVTRKQLQEFVSVDLNCLEGE